MRKKSVTTENRKKNVKEVIDNMMV